MERCRPGARGPLHGFLFICTRAPLSLVPGHPRRWWPLLHTNRQKNRLVELSGEVLRGVPWTGPSCCSAGVRGDISVLLSEELDGVSRLASTEKSVMLQQREGTPHAAEGPRPLRTPAPAPRISCWRWVTARCWLVGEGGFSPQTEESYFGYDRFTRQKTSVCSSSKLPFLPHAANRNREREVFAILEQGKPWAFKAQLKNSPAIEGGVFTWKVAAQMNLSSLPRLTAGRVVNSAVSNAGGITQRLSLPSALADDFPTCCPLRSTHSHLPLGPGSPGRP